MNELGERFAAQMPALCEATLAALEAELPKLVAGLDRDFLRAGIVLTNGRMADHLRGVAPPADTVPEAERPHVQLARVAAQVGVPLPTLDRAYRIGAARAWDVIVRVAEELPLTAAAALELAELHVAYVDTLSAESLAGFRTEAEAVGAALARDRQLLLEALLHASGRSDVAALADAARWPLPARVRAGVMRGAPATLPTDVLAGRFDGATAVLVAEDAPLDPKLPLALGPALPLDEARASLTQARRLVALAAAGRLESGAVGGGAARASGLGAARAGGGMVRWEEHLTALTLHADPAAADALAARALAPLDGLPEPHARLLRETLAAWLDHPGQPAAMGRALHLHPQTVRYRIGRLRDRFGAALDDPRARFELQLALRIRGDGR